ncbi:MAG: hypothetical protein RIA71_10610 [Oceanicaulis sp.]
MDAPNTVSALADLETRLGFDLPDIPISLCDRSTRAEVGLAEGHDGLVCLEGGRDDVEAVSVKLQRQLAAHGYTMTAGEGPAATYVNAAQSVRFVTVPLRQNAEVWVVLAGFEAL